jgi:hypothetical protein
LSATRLNSSRTYGFCSLRRCVGIPIPIPFPKQCQTIFVIDGLNGDQACQWAWW